MADAPKTYQVWLGRTRTRLSQPMLYGQPLKPKRHVDRDLKPVEMVLATDDIAEAVTFCRGQDLTSWVFHIDPTVQVDPPYLLRRSRRGIETGPLARRRDVRRSK